MFDTHGTFIDTDILVIGAGGGGLLAALSAKRNGPPGTRVSLLDAWTVGHCGHTPFSNAWTVVVEPDDDLSAVTNEIIAGNDWVADQPLIRRVLETSWDRLHDLESVELVFPREDDGSYVRRPTRGLNHTRVMHPVGGGLEFSRRLAHGLAEEGVQFLNRIFITGLMKGGGDRVVGAVGVHGRTGEVHVIRGRATIMATNAITFRSGFVRDITGTGTLLAYKAGAVLRNAEFSYTRPSTPRHYFEGITFAIQDGARFVNEKGEQFMARYDPVRKDEADVPVIARAMAMEHQAGNAPVYLDMSGIPAARRDYYIHANVGWMEHFYTKLSDEARTDMFGKVPYYPLNQMTKMAIRTDADCRSDVPGLLAAGLAQAGCANHFAGFHIGMCIGTGWISGESAVQDLESISTPDLDKAEIAALSEAATAPLQDGATARTDVLLTELQRLMFAYDVSVWKHADRLENALRRLDAIRDGFGDIAAPHVHELVRLKETEAMLLAAEIILRTSLMRPESRLSHFREDFDRRDDENWLAWIDVTERNGAPDLEKTPIPTPIHPVSA